MKGIENISKQLLSISNQFNGTRGVVIVYGSCLWCWEDPNHARHVQQGGGGVCMVLWTVWILQAPKTSTIDN